MIFIIIRDGMVNPDGIDKMAKAPKCLIV